MMGLFAAGLALMAVGLGASIGYARLHPPYEMSEWELYERTEWPFTPTP